MRFDTLESGEGVSERARARVGSVDADVGRSVRACRVAAVGRLGLEGGKLLRGELRDLLAGVCAAVRVGEVSPGLLERLSEVGLLDAPRRAGARR